MNRITMQRQGVLSTHRVDRRRPRLRKNSFVAVSLCRPAARKPCGLPYRAAPAKKRDTRPERRVSGLVCTKLVSIESEHNTRPQVRIRSQGPMLFKQGCAQ